MNNKASTFSVAQITIVPLSPHKNQLSNQNNQAVLILKVTREFFPENARALPTLKDQNSSEIARIDKIFY